MISTFAGHVQSWLDSLTYREDSGQEMFIFTGDTRPCQAVADLAKGVDVVVLVCVRINDDIEDMEESSHREGAR